MCVNLRRAVRRDRRAVPRTGERVPYVIAYGEPGRPLIQSVRAPAELLADEGARPNAHYYITKAIVPPLTPVPPLPPVRPTTSGVALDEELAPSPWVSLDAAFMLIIVLRVRPKRVATKNYGIILDGFVGRKEILILDS